MEQIRQYYRLCGLTTKRPPPVKLVEPAEAKALLAPHLQQWVTPDFELIDHVIGGDDDAPATIIVIG